MVIYEFIFKIQHMYQISLTNTVFLSMITRYVDWTNQIMENPLRHSTLNNLFYENGFNTLLKIFALLKL